jgi:hypothetical protein
MLFLMIVVVAKFRISTAVMDLLPGAEEGGPSLGFAA